MKEVIDIFKQIQDTSSLNDKKKIIGSNKDNELFKKCLVFLLDNNIVTGISDKKINKPDAKLERLFCKARPIPKPNAPKAAIKDVVGIPIWFKQINTNPTSKA